VADNDAYVLASQRLAAGRPSGVPSFPLGPFRRGIRAATTGCTVPAVCAAMRGIRTHRRPHLAVRTVIAERVTPRVFGHDGPAAPGEPRVLSGWGRTAPSLCYVIRPRSSHWIERTLGSSDGNGAIARGLGGSWGDAAQNRGGRVVDMTQMGGVRRLDLVDGLATVGAGADLDTLMRVLLPFGLFVPATLGTRCGTVGGAIANDVDGIGHHHEGGFAQHVTSMCVVTGGGELQTLTPDGTPDPFRSTAGGLGLTGVIIEATLGLTRVETAWMRVDTERCRDVDDVLGRLGAAEDGGGYAVARIDGAASGQNLGRAVLTRANHAAIEELPAAIRSHPQRLEPGWRSYAPTAVPAWMSGRVGARAFDAVRYRWAPRGGSTKLRPLASFLQRPDTGGGRSRPSGHAAIIRYRFAVPSGAERTLQRVLEGSAINPCRSLRTVLTRSGLGSGLLSFPIAGWTLALDFPAASHHLGPMLDGFDRLVVEAGGRVDLAEDSRLRPELLPAMYGELDRWLEIREQLDPRGTMRSDLARRLGLVEPGRTPAGT
jgi:decaprenylphospho-beta-D-ribofuranose 2-oxidase